METKEIQNMLYLSFKRQAKENIVIAAEKKQFLKSDIKLHFSLGDKAHIYINTVHNEYSKGEFGVVSNFMLTNGHIEKIINATGIDILFENKTIIQGHSSIIDKLNFEPYSFNKNTNIDKVVKNIVLDIQEFFIPYIKSVTYDYKIALRNFSDKKYFLQLNNPFTVGVVLAFLAKEESFIQELVNMATTPYSIDLFDRKDCFYDYHSSPNPQNYIIDPIKNWFIKNPDWRSGFLK